MNLSETNEFEASYNARVVKIRKAAAIALKEIDRLRSGGRIMEREAFDAEVARITREKLQPYGCDLIVHSVGDGAPAIPDQGPEHEERIRSNQKFFPSRQWSLAPSKSGLGPVWSLFE